MCEYVAMDMWLYLQLQDYDHCPSIGIS